MTQSQHFVDPAVVSDLTEVESLAIAESEPLMRSAKRVFRFSIAALLLIAWITAPRVARCAAEQEQGVTSAKSANDSFPDLNEVFQGRVFRSKFERDVFFLRRIHESYSSYWPALLDVNISVRDYVLAPDKLLRFVEELGAAMADTDDLTVSKHLAAVTSDPAFYANTNAYRPEILRAAASALIQIGPSGRRALAASFSENHYRADAVSLEILAETAGKSGVADSNLTAAIAAIAFTITATNGGSYPRCTTGRETKFLGCQR